MIYLPYRTRDEMLRAVDRLHNIQRAEIEADYRRQWAETPEEAGDLARQRYDLARAWQRAYRDAAEDAARAKRDIDQLVMARIKREHERNADTQQREYAARITQLMDKAQEANQ